MKYSLAQRGVLIGAGLLLSSMAGAYNGQNCSAPGVCWEAKPGFSATIAGSKGSEARSKGNRQAEQLHRPDGGPQQAACRVLPQDRQVHLRR